MPPTPPGAGSFAHGYAAPLTTLSERPPADHAVAVAALEAALPDGWRGYVQGIEVDEAPHAVQPWAPWLLGWGAGFSAPKKKE